VIDFLHRTIVSSAQLANDLDFVHVDAKALSIFKVDSFRVQDGFLGESQRTRWIPVTGSTRVPVFTDSDSHDLAKVGKLVVVCFGSTLHARQVETSWWASPPCKACRPAGSSWST
jgi:hypothetical protein